METGTPKVLDIDALVAQREVLRASGKTVVQCHGCFDIVHPGHVRYLRYARAQGDALIVTVTSDAFVAKGFNRPYIDEQLRADSLAALECVDYVAISRAPTAKAVLEVLRPDIYVKGKEYETLDDVRFADERALVEGYGGRVIFSSGDVVYSSSAILEQTGDQFGLGQDRVHAFCRRNMLSLTALQQGLRKMVGLRVVVLGDAIVDEYVHCESLGQASEAPMLNVVPMRREMFLGGPALVAMQLASLGAEVTLVTSFAPSPAARVFETELEKGRVQLRNVVEQGRMVATKQRFLVEQTKVLKVDEGRYAPASTTTMADLERALQTTLAKNDALIATDFGFGLMTSSVARSVAALCQANKRPYTVDVSERAAPGLTQFLRPFLATPTESELRRALAEPHAGLSVLASQYYARTHAKELIVTLGRQGAVAFGPPQGREPLRTEYLPSLARTVSDPVGCGDVFLATLSAARLTGAVAPLALYLASCAAGLHAARVGNRPVFLPELEQDVLRRHYQREFPSLAEAV